MPAKARQKKDVAEISSEGLYRLTGRGSLVVNGKVLRSGETITDKEFEALPKNVWKLFSRVE